MVFQAWYGGRIVAGNGPVYTRGRRILTADLNAAINAVLVNPSFLNDTGLNNQDFHRVRIYV